MQKAALMEDSMSTSPRPADVSSAREEKEGEANDHDLEDLLDAERAPNRTVSTDTTRSSPDDSNSDEAA